jgi:hypothetical protein
MRHLLAALLVLSLAACCRAADEPKPNTLTPKEIAEGWILLFDGETTFGWKPGTSESDKKPDVTVKNSELILTGYNTYADFTTPFRYFELQCEYRTEGTGELSNDAHLSIAVPGHLWGFGMESAKGKWGRMQLRFNPDGHEFHRKDDPDKKSFVKKGNLPKKLGPATLQFSPVYGENSKLSLRNVKIKPLATTPIFNGKDLTGWKEFPGRKSKFSVSKEGWLSIKNGPGDLQTTGQWADFVLQLECRTNGANLNSGVFFRCQPDKYQQGYEAQIQNQGAKEPKTYTIEEFDPKTHELKDKKKIKNWSVDYGTGAIYRRMPARKAVAKDREWFTMTVIAHGRHVATWVNGIQVVDWTDNRPAKDNAREGYRAPKGPISLQGHDPTTDLSFRNLRITDLATKD